MFLCPSRDASNWWGEVREGGTTRLCCSPSVTRVLAKSVRTSDRNQQTPPTHTHTQKPDNFSARIACKIYAYTLVSLSRGWPDAGLVTARRVPCAQQKRRHATVDPHSIQHRRAVTHDNEINTHKKTHATSAKRTHRNVTQKEPCQRRRRRRVVGTDVEHVRRALSF